VHMHRIKFGSEKIMRWRGRGRNRGNDGIWPGHGPFNNLPPWQRPGWLYGRGACWRLYPNYNSTEQQDSDQASVPPQVLPTPNLPRFTKEQETQLLEQQRTTLQSQLDAIKNRLTELTKE
jgi:hypothetical protein